MQVYLVGGAVRDKLLGIDSYDNDWVVVGATPEMMLSQGYTAVGKDFPVFLHPKSKEEHALARTERKSGSGYTGFECFFDQNVTLEEDLIRRDLTINAMAMESDGTIHDHMVASKISTINCYAMYQTPLLKTLYAFYVSLASLQSLLI